jgi:hypothetical protein
MSTHTNGAVTDAAHSMRTFTDQLRMSVAAMEVAHPEKTDALRRAHAAIVEGYVIDLGNGNGTVLSGHGGHAYTTNGVCECTAASFGKSCRHLQAWRLYQHVQKQLDAQAPEATPAALPTIKAEWLTEVHGVKCMKYAGLLALAMERGLVSLEARWTYNDEGLSLAEAVATFQDGRRFVECGDSTPQSGKRVGEHWRRLSLTRAKARGLRDALNIGMVAVEELE